MFIPFAYEDTYWTNDIRAYLEEMDDSEEIDKILIKAIEIEEKRR